MRKIRNDILNKRAVIVYRREELTFKSPFMYFVVEITRHLVVVTFNLFNSATSELNSFIYRLYNYCLYNMYADVIH